MALFDKQLELITEADLLFLIENQKREGYQIEYKQAVSFQNKQDKLNFLAAVTSFANSVGGNLTIGVAVKNAIPVAVPGWEGIDFDQEKLRIENLLCDHVEPRVSFKIRDISLQKRKRRDAARVPWSWAQPHMVRMEQLMTTG